LEGSTLNKGIYFIVAIVAALFILSNNHLDHSVGDRIFNILGISPWTEKNQSGLHLSVLLGFIILIVGVVGATKYYRPRDPKVLSRIIIGCIAFVFVYPIATEKVMLLIKYNTSGIESVDYSKKNSRCNFQSEGNSVKANCSFTIYNYGDENRITIRPILTEVEFESRELSIRTHSKVNIGTEFYGKQRNGTGFAGSSQDIEAEIELNGIKKKYK
jgi:hypothetical protein